ncbi:MAG: hypothetical protein SGJ13_09335, partial [Actinomycetota bacterium]|nr:hypothetical protein [Actinomycetota bacterium]
VHSPAQSPTLPAAQPISLAGETLAVPERVIVARSAGVFRPIALADGVVVEAGGVVGFVDSPGASAEVRSPFRGTLMGMMAHKGERLREGQPVAWLRVA